MADEGIQTVRGTVRETSRGTFVETGPIRVGPDGRAEAVVEFDKPVNIPLSLIFPDPELRESFERGVAGVLACTSSRIDDIAASGGLDPATDLAGSDLSGLQIVGEPGRPIDMRGWDLAGTDLSGCRFEHVLVDEATVLTGADLSGITGPDADAVLACAATVSAIR